MKKTSYWVLLISLLSLPVAHAATVKLKDGQTLTGTIEKQDSNGLVINSDGIKMTIPTDKVESIDFAGSASTKPDTATQSATPAAPAQKVESKGLIPSGAPIVVKMQDEVDSRNSAKGQQFTAKLESALMDGDKTVAPRGAIVYGKVTEVHSSRRLVGKASLTVELTGILINNQIVSINTTPMSGSGDSTAKDTAGKTARAAAIGGLADGRDGAETGAKVGLGLALLTRGQDIVIPTGQLVTFHLSTDFTY